MVITAPTIQPPQPVLTAKDAILPKSQVPQGHREVEYPIQSLPLCTDRPPDPERAVKNNMNLLRV